MSDSVESTVTGSEVTQKLQETIAVLDENPDSCIRIRSQWFLEIEMPVNEEGDPVDGPVDEAEATAWMICTGVKTDRAEINKIREFREKKNPEDRIRVVREEILHIVEP